MKIYFLSATPCVLRVNGVFFGMVDTFERFAECSLKDNLFIEFLSQNLSPIRFFLTENIRFSPPEGCEVYLLKNAIAIYARDFACPDARLQILSQIRTKNCLITFFRQGKTQLCAEWENGFFTAEFPEFLFPCQTDFLDGLLVLRGEKGIAVYDEKGKILLCEKTVSHRLEDNILHARLPLSDRLKRYADCVWSLEKGQCIQTQFTLLQEEICDAPTEELIPYAFFESVLLKADYAQFLSDELAQKAEDVLSFLGEYENVALTENPLECALLRRKGERIWEASYFKVELQNGRICDIKG